MINWLFIGLTALVVFGLTFFLLVIWVLNQGMLNKFGPEYIPMELGIKFNHRGYSTEDKSKFVYQLSEYEMREILQQIDVQIDNQNGLPESGLNTLENHVWRKPSDHEYQFINEENGNARAIIDLNLQQLIYLKQ
jgi:hypothetical protein